MVCSDDVMQILAKMVLEVENQIMEEASPFECKDEKDAANLAFYYTGVSMMAVALMRKLGEKR